MDLKNVDLLKLQTGAMKNDATTQAMCAALNPLIKQLANQIELCQLLSRVDNLTEDILDQLAHELHVDWYDATASIGVKRDLIKNSGKVHQYLGTPYAIEQVIQDYFGDGYVEEWFDYNGDPYHFKVITSNPSVSGDEAERFAKAIEKVKRGSAILEAVVISMSAQLDIYYGFVLHTGDFYTVEQVG